MSYYCTFSNKKCPYFVIFLGETRPQCNNLIKINGVFPHNLASIQFRLSGPTGHSTQNKTKVENLIFSTLVFPSLVHTSMTEVYWCTKTLLSCKKSTLPAMANNYTISSERQPSPIIMEISCSPKSRSREIHTSTTTNELQGYYT